MSTIMNQTVKQRTYSRYAKEAALLLGKEIEYGRKSKGFSTKNFAERIGISRVTLQKIESGNMKCELGIVLEAAAIAGVPLFDAPPPRHLFQLELARAKDKIALLPKRVRKLVIDNDF